MQNFFSKMDPSGGSGSASSDGTPWWLKYGSKGIGIAAGIAAMLFGLMVVLTLSPLCIVAGIWQICAGFLVILVEAPFCCMFLDFVQKFSGLVENRPIWQKAALYLVLAFPPISMCFSLSTLLGSGAIFAAAVVNGLQVIGKKGSAPPPDAAPMAPEMGDESAVIDEQQYPASREEMATKATGSVDSPPTYNEAMGSGLVDNIQGQDIEAARSKN